MKIPVFLLMSLILTANLAGQAPKNKAKAVRTEMTIEALNGRETIATAKRCFSLIDTDFTLWGLNNPGPSTEKTNLMFYWPNTEDSTFCRLFNGPDRGLDTMTLTQHQIIRFCRKYAAILRGYTNFFIFKDNGEYFVAIVYKDQNDLIAVARKRFLAFIWLGDLPRRLIIPRP